MSRPAPPAPLEDLDRLLARLRRRARAVDMDPGFPLRVEAAVRRRRREERSLPAWVGFAAALLLAFLAGLAPARERARAGGGREPSPPRTPANEERSPEALPPVPGAASPPDGRPP